MDNRLLKSEQFAIVNRVIAALSLVMIMLVSVLSHAAESSQTVASPVSTSQQNARVLIRDVTMIEGVRDNPLIGYGIVIGLKGTGDRQQTVFTTQTLANVLQRLGLQIPATSVQVRNVAAVIVTASLPPFARPGTTLDVTVASV